MSATALLPRCGAAPPFTAAAAASSASRRRPCPSSTSQCRRRQRCGQCLAQQQPQQRGEATRERPPTPPPSLGSSQGSIKPAAQQQAADSSWRLLDWAAWQQGWDVPWGGATVAITMGVWCVGFAGTAFLIMPAAYTAVVGQSLWDLPPSGQADFALWSEVAEVLLTAAILGAVVARHRPQVAAQQLFNYSPAQPFKRGTGWLAWGLLGVAASPLVVGATALALTALSYDSLTSGGHGTVDGVAGMITIDWPTYVRLVSVTGVLAPLLEESLFRGFLLTSLTKVMPPWAAVVASSFAFGLAHLSLRDLPVLFALGCWLGAIYCRSRNLLTPMLVHGAWNSTVLTILFWLASQGIDIPQLLKERAF